jgi:hypothetical protein
MSNRQLTIIGSFAVVCCAIIAIAMQMRPLSQAPTSAVATVDVGRYQFLSVHPGESGAFVVVLDTATGETWQARLAADLLETEKWHALGSPAKKSLPLASNSAI